MKEMRAAMKRTQQKKREVKLWCRKRKGERQSNGETITHAYIIGYIAFNPIGTNNEVSLISCICNERMIDRMRQKEYEWNVEG